MALGVGLQFSHKVTVLTGGPTQLANYIYGVALGVSWALVRPWLGVAWRRNIVHEMLKIGYASILCVSGCGFNSNIKMHFLKK
jgi:hypothetical protein